MASAGLQWQQTGISCRVMRRNTIPGMHTFAVQTARHLVDTIYHTGQPDAQMQPYPSRSHLAPGDAATATRLSDVMTWQV